MHLVFAIASVSKRFMAHLLVQEKVEKGLAGQKGEVGEDLGEISPKLQ